MQVQTYRGPIDTSELGVTLMHEHVFCSTPEVNMAYPETWPDDDHLAEIAIRELDEAKADGVDTLVDLTVIGLGRNVERVKRVADATKLNIIAASGLYTFMDLTWSYFRNRGPGSRYAGPEIMTDFFVKDVQAGIGNTGVRAAIFKCATDESGLTPAVERVLRAVAQAHRRTGAPISTHTRVEPNGRDQQAVFRQEGVDLARVVIGHVDNPDNSMEYLEELMNNGSTIGFDHCGSVLIDDDESVRRVAQLVGKGYTDRIILSHDRFSYADSIPSTAYAGFKRRYSHVVNTIVPKLKASGVNERQIEQMLVTTPRRIFETARGSY